MRTLTLLLALALSAASSGMAKEEPKYPPLPEQVKAAKTIYLENQSARSDVFNHLYEPLSNWGRWKVVGDRSSADLRLILTNTSPTGKNYRFNRYWFLIITEPNNEAPLLYISADIAVSTVKGAARGLVKKLCERIENAAEPQEATKDSSKQKSP